MIISLHQDTSPVQPPLLLTSGTMAAQLHIPIYTSMTQLFADLGPTADHAYVTLPPALFT